MGPPGMSLSVTFQKKKKKKMNEEYNFCDTFLLAKRIQCAFK